MSRSQPNAHRTLSLDKDAGAGADVDGRVMPADPSTRRLFLRMAGLALLGATLPSLAAQSRNARPKSKPRFTLPVRARVKTVKVRRGRWTKIIVHHSGVRSGNAAIYDRGHRSRGMENGLAYHFVIGNGVDSGDGEIEVGSRWLRQIKGGHMRSDQINEVAIGICLVGNFDRVRPTPNQVASLKELLTYLRYEVVGTHVKVQSHREAHPGHTACPGRYFPVKELQSLSG